MKFYDIRRCNEFIDKNIEIKIKERRMTIREFINKNSCAAWITFCFHTDDGKPYSCISVADFVRTYGSASKHILDDYLVLGQDNTEPSQSQGMTYFLYLTKAKGGR